ncbi:MAG: type VI secretion system contractile sheath large subunit [Phycisphaerales bacterium]|nr:type VI secretion system contractile sheath large subunit [Phycisphaerales bacterium]
MNSERASSLADAPPQTATWHVDVEPSRVEATSAPVDAAPTLLDSVVAATASHQSDARTHLEAFLQESSGARALRMWAGSKAPAAGPRARDLWLQMLARDIAAIDAMLNQQLNAVLHHRRFQQLEASWRGLRYLVDQADADENVHIRMLSVSWQELTKDAERALEFDQSQLFRKVYTDEFDSPGGTPFGLLIGDYQIQHLPSPDHPDDLGTVASIAQVAAAAFAPFIGGADPAMFGLENFSQFDRPMDLSRVFEQVEYVKWNALRQVEDARFVGMTLPHTLMRLPYADDNFRPDSFCFREEVEGPDQSKYLWGNAAYAFGAVVIRAFIDSGWLAEIRGVKRGEDGGGLVADLPSCSFGTDKAGIALKSSTDLIISDDLEKELNDLGFVPLSHCKDTPYCAFYGNQSIQKPKLYDQPAATMNSKISSMMQYILCASRIAHYLKVVAREKIGSFSEATDLEEYLKRWVHQYVTPDSEAPAKVKAQFPLREAQVRVRERPGSPGNYACEMHLLPHYQLDALTASVRLRTELAPARSA